MNILKEKLSEFASKKSYTAPTMEVVVMNHHTDLLECSTCEETDKINSSTLKILEE